MNQLRLWLNEATPQEKAMLAERAGTTTGTLNQIAGGYRSNGEAMVRSGLARRIEQAAAGLRKINRNLPELFRTDLAPECRECEFAQKCLGNKAANADFAPVEDTGGG